MHYYYVFGDRTNKYLPTKVFFKDFGTSGLLSAIERLKQMRSKLVYCIALGLRYCKSKVLKFSVKNSKKQT